MNAPRRTFLLEVGCEEIPAGMLPAALQDLSARLLDALGGEDRLGGRAQAPAPYGGPRRLAAVITGIADREQERVAVVTGPPLAAAFDAEGRPTKAAIGFAKAQGVPIERLERVAGEKGQVVAARKTIAGRRATEVLAAACPKILSTMRFPKMMRWGDRGYCFVRPVHWIVALLDDEVVPFEFLGVSSGRATRGHRFLAPGPHDIPDAQDYERVLLEKGKVIAGNASRRERIREQRSRAAARMGWSVAEDQPLLEELTFLSECPGVIAGTFPEALLDLPEPVLVTAMKHHQKYFPARRADGRLAPGFMAVINQESDPTGVIRRGNEWVLKARLADASFFWDEDRKRTLEQRLPDLERVTFQEKLGSVLSRCRRLETLASWIAESIGLAAGEAAKVRAAARLAKSDLTSGMVGEFPELQGVMGAIYARAEGLDETIAMAIEEHYWPMSPDTPVPSSRGGRIVAIADKLDLLAGCFGAGLIPKGSADPYGLRRAALGLCRILIGEEPGTGSFSLGLALTRSLALYADQGILSADTTATAEAIAAFVAQRLQFLMEETGMRFDTARAVISAGMDDVRDVWLRAEALTALRGPEHEADFLSLATSAKRIRNILAQAREKRIEMDESAVDPDQLVDREERDLHTDLTEAAAALGGLIAGRRYQPALKRIAAMRPAVDRFFDKVLVMSPDAALRRNRLALLHELSVLLRRVADFSEIVVEGEAVERRA